MHIACEDCVCIHEHTLHQKFSYFEDTVHRVFCGIMGMQLSAWFIENLIPQGFWFLNNNNASVFSLSLMDAMFFVFKIFDLLHEFCSPKNN